MSTRLRDKKEIRALRHQTYQYLKEYGFTINSDDYVQLYLASFDPALILTPQQGNQTEYEL